jgi:oligosaccharide repeat unit polymerase
MMSNAKIFLRPKALIGLMGLSLVFGYMNFKWIDEFTTYQMATLILSEILALQVLAFFTFKRHLRMFEPITLFSSFYLTIVPVAMYLLFTDFRGSNIVDSTSFNIPTDRLLMMAMVYYVVGYFAVIMGYYVIRTNRSVFVTLKSKNPIPDILLTATITIFLFIGFSNFAYNIYAVAGGDFFSYIVGTAGLRYQFEETGKGYTTIGYHFAWVALYVWFYKILRKGKVITKPFLSCVLICLFMKISTGRITSTLVFLFSFFIIYYFVNIKDQDRESWERKSFILIVLMAVMGITLYYSRLMSGLYYQNILELQKIVDVLSIENFLSYAVGRGNLPNIPIFMKIIDAWDQDIGFLYGKTLLTWVLSIVPTGIINPHEYLISWTINNTWFSHLVGAGGLPPTGVGEMYANFGPVGPLIGMFLFGLFCGALYNCLVVTRSYWVLVVYSQLLLGFVMIYPKTDFANLSPWYIFPILITVAVLKVFAIAISRRQTP